MRTITVSALVRPSYSAAVREIAFAPALRERISEELDCFRPFWKSREKEFIEITGLNPSTIYSVNKLMWLKQNCQDLYGRAVMVFTFQDFLIHTLAGVRAIDFSMASRTGLFDCNENSWSDRLLETSGIREGLLSEPVRGGTVVGKSFRMEAFETQSSPRYPDCGRNP